MSSAALFAIGAVVAVAVLLLFLLAAAFWSAITSRDGAGLREDLALGTVSIVLVLAAAAAR